MSARQRDASVRRRTFGALLEVYMQPKIAVIDIERYSSVERVFVDGVQVLANSACHPVYNYDTELD